VLQIEKGLLGGEKETNFDLKGKHLNKTSAACF
jgi:hypothetical protein